MSCRGSRGSTHTHTHMHEHTLQHQRPHQLGHCPGHLALSESLALAQPFTSDRGLLQSLFVERSVPQMETTYGDLLF